MFVPLTLNCENIIKHVNNLGFPDDGKKIAGNDRRIEVMAQS